MLLEQPQQLVDGQLGGAQVRGFAREAFDMIEVSPRLSAYNLGYLALAWMVALAALAVFWEVRAWYTFLVAFLVVSSRQQAMLNIEHECQHGKFMAARRWNTFIGRWLCAAAVGSPYEAARTRHLSHHRLLATGDDPDLDLYSGPGKRTRAGMFKHFVGGLVGGYAGMVLMGPPPKGSSSDASGRRRDAVSLVAVQAVIAAGLTLVFDWWVYPTLWLMPLVTVTVLSHLVRSFVEHAITDEENRRHSNRLITIRSNFLERFFVSPYAMNYHAEHHLVPSVPAPRLKRLRRRLENRADLPPLLVRSSYGEAIRRYVRALPND